jgi:hypothetical protein
MLLAMRLASSRVSALAIPASRGSAWPFYLRLERPWGGRGGQFIVRQFSPCFGVSAFAHLLWHSSFTPQMALGEQSLQAHSFLEEPPFSSQYRYAFASSTIHISATNVSTEANVMVFMEDLKG